MNYKSSFYIVAFLLMFVVIFGCYSMYQVHKTLNQIHITMDDDQITKYIDAGWMPPLDYRRKIRKKEKKEKK